jgi:alcohol dehydrogenase class IV
MLVVSDSVLSGLGLVAKVERGLAAAGVDSLVFDRVEPNVPSHLVEEGLEMYKSFRCDGIVAVGGGSPMDCAKLIGACVCKYGPCTYSTAPCIYPHPSILEVSAHGNDHLQPHAPLLQP